MTPSGEVGSQTLRWHCDVNLSGTIEHRGNIAGGAKVGWQHHTWHVITVAAGVVDLFGSFVAPGPQPNVVAGVGKHLGESGSPTSGSHDRYFAHSFAFFLKLPVAASPVSAVFQRRSGAFSPRNCSTSLVILSITRSVAS